MHQRFLDSRVELAVVTEEELSSAADTDSPQGVLAIAEVPAYSLASIPERDTLRVLILDAVQDPGNVGSMIRTAAALGVDATLAMPGTVDVWNAKVVRSAMGTHFRHPAVQVGWPDLDTVLMERGIELWGTDADGETLTADPSPRRLALAVGNEGAGLTAEARARASRIVGVPLAAGVDSLNVAVAAAILLHELRP